MPGNVGSGRAGASGDDDGVGREGGSVVEPHLAIIEAGDPTASNGVSERVERGECVASRCCPTGHGSQPSGEAVHTVAVDDGDRDPVGRHSSGGVEAGVASADDQDAVDSFDLVHGQFSSSTPSMTWTTPRSSTVTSVRTMGTPLTVG